MKFSKSLKFILFSLLGLMYISGTIQWLLKTFFQVDTGLGPEPLPAFIWILKFHGTTSILALLLFGYVLRDHVMPSWQIGRHKKSGLFLSGYLFLILLTLPFLWYLTDENMKSTVALVHSFLGLCLILPFLIHLLVKRKIWR